MRSFRVLWAAVPLALLMPATSAAEPVSALPGGFQGAFDFMVSDGVVLQATLKLPAGGGPFPLAVLMHGGKGVSELENEYALDFTSRGYATAIIDSFSGRGFRPESGSGAGAGLRPSARVVDAYAALKVLGTHTQIDKQRAVLFGRSHGGAAVMLASTSWARSRYSPDGAGYRGFVALYPPCSASYPEFDKLAGPLRLHLGMKDELTPAKACEAIVSRMSSQGQDARTTLYNDAHHAFDASAPVEYFGQWINYGSCEFQLPSVDAPLPADELKRCARRGASAGGNPKALALLRQNIAGELAGMLGKPIRAARVGEE